MKKEEKIRHLIPPGGASFIVRVLNCQQNNWKGEIRWLDGKETVYFRSLLEMIMLIQDALEKQDMQNEVDDFRFWTEVKEVTVGRDKK